MEVQLVSNDKHPTVKLVNGEYHAGTAGSSDYADVLVVPDFIALGDINGDGQGDAAILLSENYGGSGVFVSLIPILNQGGQPVQAGSGARIDDRPKMTALQIQDGRINFTGSIHGPNDPMCCAAQGVVESYGLTKAGLQLLRFASDTPNGQRRTITIESPTNGSTVKAGPVQVKGSYTVSPFENTLVYQVTDQTGKELSSGPITVQGQMGQPGTFDASIDLSTVPAGVLVTISISDKSAADGSILAMDSVEVLIQ